MKDNINEHDKTKQMMDIIRNGFKSKLITEAEEPTALQPTPEEQPQPTALQPGDDLPEPETTNDESSDVITPVHGDSVFTAEQDKLEAIDPNIELQMFKIYPEDKDVMIQGSVSVEGNDIRFTMKYQEGKLLTDFDEVNTNKKMLEVLGKLEGYFVNFSNEWAVKLRKEYPSKKDKPA